MKRTGAALEYETAVQVHMPNAANGKHHGAKLLRMVLYGASSFWVAAVPIPVALSCSAWHVTKEAFTRVIKRGKVCKWV